MSSNGDSADAKKQGMRGWVKALFVLSLALNLLIIGGVSAMFVTGKKWGKRWGGTVSIMHEGRHFVRSLPRERRREIRRIAKAHRNAFDPVRVQSREARLALAAALEAEPFDRQAYNQALDKLKTAVRAAADPAADLLTKVVDKLTPEERKAFAKRLKRERRWRRRRK